MAQIYTIWHRIVYPEPERDIKEHILGDFSSKAEAIAALQGILWGKDLKEATEEEAERADFPAQWYEIKTRIGFCVYYTPLYHYNEEDKEVKV